MTNESPASGSFDVAGLIFPIVTARQDGAQSLKIGRFIGSGFWIDSAGHFLTCKHVLDQVKEGELPAIGNPFSDARDRYTPIIQSTSHNAYDMAIGFTPPLNRTRTPHLSRFEGNLLTGQDVSAFGFNSGGVRGNSLELDVRYLKGHLSRVHSQPDPGLPTPSILEVSFGSPSGFSGTPLLVNHRVAGMLFGNIETRLQAYALSEVVEDAREYKEVAYRVYEYGLAHPVKDLVEFCEHEGITPFE